MSTTEVKRGRPAKKADAPKKFAVKQNVKERTVKEYQLCGTKSAVYMMHQRNITVYDKESDQVRQIRFCPNEPSIFVDEQSDNAVRRSIVFTDGRLFVRPEQPNLRDFLEAHPDNKANGGKVFEVVDKTRKAKLDVESEFAVADAIVAIKEKPFEDLLAVAAALNYSVDREAAEIKHDLLMYAKKNPNQFMSMFDDPQVTTKAKIRMAMKYDVIYANKGAVRWKDSGNMIVSVPVGKDPVDVMLRYCMTDSGAATLEEMERQL